MTGQFLLLLLALPVLTGLVWMRFRRSDARQQFVQNRLHTITGRGGSESVLKASLLRAAAPGALFRLPQRFRRRLDIAFNATGKRIRLLHLTVAALISAVVATGFCNFILDLNPALTLLFAAVATGIGPVVLLRMAQNRYRRRFLDVFPDALDLLGRGVKAGLPVNEALAAAGNEIADPVGSELRWALAEVQIGVPMIDALQQVAVRVRAADFRFLIVALALQSKTGGSLAQTLANLSGVIRARKALRLKARALTAEAKASAAVLAALPFVVGVVMFLMNHDLVATLWIDPRGRFMLGVAFLSLLTGLTTMYVMVKRALR
jgi:tight adherence protein B